MRRLIVVCLLGLTLWAAPVSLVASPVFNYRALIVGVSEYPGLTNKSLHGPKNDATRMRDLLITRGVSSQNITVLADGVPGSAALPTRQRILAELDQLASTAKPNDYIIIHISGHGSQQPVPENSPYAADEPDGLVEIFLPRDVAGWGDSSTGGEVKNAITKYEIRAVVDRMTATGAFVWAIFDSCHSATLVRGPDNPGVRLRQVAPDELGIPKQTIDRAVGRAKTVARPQAGAAVAKKPAATPGRAVYFYAAQTHEPAPEMTLPRDTSASGRAEFGLFSYTVIQALEGGSGMTYQQLGQQVLTRYAGDGDARATPSFSGTALDSGVFGQPASLVRQWTLSPGATLSMPAGELADIHQGAVVAILPAALSGTEDALGYAKVIRTTATSSELAPTAHAGLPERPVADLQLGKIARLVQPAMQFSFIVAADLRQCEQPCPFNDPLSKMRSAGDGTGGVTGAQIKWVNPSDSSNLVLKAEGRRLWLMPPSLTQSKIPTESQARLAFEKSLVYLDAAPQASSQGIQTSLSQMLRQASKAGNLMRVAATLSNAAAVATLQVTMFHVSAKGIKTPITTDASMPKLRSGDKIQVEMKNIGRKAIDVTALYLDSKYGVQAMFPSPGSSNRLEAQSESSGAASFLFDINDSTLGTERLAFVVVEAVKHAERADYSFLEQATLSSNVVSRGGPDIQFFRDAGFADHVIRGAAPSAPPSATGMLVYSWQIVP